MAVSFTSRPVVDDRVPRQVHRRAGRSAASAPSGSLRRDAPQQRADARDQLVGAERLGDVVVGADLEADDAVGLLGARRHHDDRDGARWPRSARSARQTSRPLMPGQHHVEDGEVDRVLRARTPARRRPTRRRAASSRPSGGSGRSARRCRGRLRQRGCAFLGAIIATRVIRLTCRTAAESTRVGHRRRSAADAGNRQHPGPDDLPRHAPAHRRQRAASSRRRRSRR